MSKRATGIVRWFDGSKGYGYIHGDDGNGLKNLKAGDRVEFLLEESYCGPQASQVVWL